MIVVDASVWVSSAVPSEAHHDVSRNRLRRETSAGNSFAMPTLALAEIAGAVRRQTGDPHLGRLAASDVLRSPGLRLVALDVALGERAAEIAADSALRGADAVYVAVAERLGVPLLTWDREVQERASTLIPVVQPS